MLVVYQNVESAFMLEYVLIKLLHKHKIYGAQAELCPTCVDVMYGTAPYPLCVYA